MKSKQPVNTIIHHIINTSPPDPEGQATEMKSETSIVSRPPRPLRYAPRFHPKVALPRITPRPWEGGVCNLVARRGLTYTVQSPFNFWGTSIIPANFTANYWLGVFEDASAGCSLFSFSWLPFFFFSFFLSSWLTHSWRWLLGDRYVFFFSFSFFLFDFYDIAGVAWSGYRLAGGLHA